MLQDYLEETDKFNISILSLVQLTCDFDPEGGGGAPGRSPLVLDHHRQQVLLGLLPVKPGPPRQPDNMDSSSGVESEESILVTLHDPHHSLVSVPRVLVSDGDQGDQLTSESITSNGEIMELNLRIMTVAPAYFSTFFQLYMFFYPT